MTIDISKCTLHVKYPPSRSQTSAGTDCSCGMRSWGCRTPAGSVEEQGTGKQKSVAPVPPTSTPTEARLSAVPLSPPPAQLR